MAVQIISNKAFQRLKVSTLTVFFRFGTFLNINLQETSTACSSETVHNYLALPLTQTQKLNLTKKRELKKINSRKITASLKENQQIC